MDLSHPLLQGNDLDPVPFPESFPQLRKLDKVVLCSICKESFTAPVSIACGHSFCSQCIRSYLGAQKADAKCPNCGAKALERDIRRNRALEDITEAWEAARPKLLELAQPARKRPAPVESRGSRSSSKRKRSQSPGSSLKDDSDIEVVGNPADELSENDEAPCPLCQVYLPIASIPQHIDRGCPPPKAKAVASGNQKKDWAKVFNQAGSSKDKAKMERLTKPHYPSLTLSQLRDLLRSHDLPTTGDRPVLEARFQEWIVLYNANLDTSLPKSTEALRVQLRKADESRARDRERGKEAEVEALKTKAGFARHAVESRDHFGRLRREILERRKGGGDAGGGGDKGGVDSPIEVE